MTSLTAWVPGRLRSTRVGFLALCALAPVALLLARLLPAGNVGLAARLFAAGICLLLVPGAIVWRALGWSALPSLALVASFGLSLAVLFVAFAVTFAVNGPVELVPALVAVIAVAAAVPAFRAATPPAERSDAIAFGAILGAGVLFAAVVWWASPHMATGDDLAHLARVRRIAEADSLTSVRIVDEFRDGGLHPGYAFPLWHGALGIVARLAGVDASLVSLHLSSMVVPVAFGAWYAAGRAVFGSWGPGVAVLAAVVTLDGFSRESIGGLRFLGQPGATARLVLAPAALALLFAFLRSGNRRLLVPLSAAAFSLAVIHDSYLILLGIPLAGFAALGLAALPDRRALAVRLGLAAAAVALPAGLFLAWLWPTISDFASYRTLAQERARALAHYGGQLQVVGDAFRLLPELITRRGPVVVAGLAAVPLAALAVRRRWGAFVVGGALLTLAILLVPDLFVRFTDAISVSQGRRLALFLPIPFAVAGAAVVAGRARILGVACALLVGIALTLAYSPEATHVVSNPGPTWPLWVAVTGSLVALPVGYLRAASVARFFEPSPWAAAAAVAFVLPAVVSGAANLERTPRDPDGLTPGLVAALDGLDDDAVVLAPVRTAHRVLAWSTVYVAATLPYHVADTGANQPYRRQRDVNGFFSPAATDAERRETLRRYGAEWVLVDKRRRYPEAFVATLDPVYEDRRYLLLSVPE